MTPVRWHRGTGEPLDQYSGVLIPLTRPAGNKKKERERKRERLFEREAVRERGRWREERPFSVSSPPSRPFYHNTL